MRSALASLVLGLACLGASGCDDTDIDSDEADISQSLTLRFESKSSGLTLKSSGKSLTCNSRFQGVDGERITCERTGETVEVIVKSSGTSVVAMRDLGQERGYYTCKPTGDVDGVPAQMKCKVTTIHPRGSGGLSSPFDSSVEGVSTPNSHWVDDDKKILRGMEPRTAVEFEELRDAGISRVLIFKNSTGNDDIGKETTSWGLPSGSVLNVPFKWKDLKDFKTPCEQTLDGLRFLKSAVGANKKVFFHCTVGEDRTGYLAALYALLFEGAEPREAFDMDMCEHGYASGNPQKPGFVLGKLDDGLTPLYRSMAFLVNRGILTKNLETSACASAPVVPDDFMSEPMTCGVSTTLVP